MSVLSGQSNFIYYSEPYVTKLYRGVFRTQSNISRAFGKKSQRLKAKSSIFAKSFILDVRLGSGYSSALL